jgi:low affinity Fe/Cu permease
MDPLEELENKIDSLIRQLTEKKNEIAGLRKQKNENKLLKNEIAVKIEEFVDKTEKDFNTLMKGLEEQFPVESDSESDSDEVNCT